ncbi:uncharacterized protein F5Z01DRAFT_659139 [Emericellopsis atlantica]|uniref:Uncharacterized protein n=1 Tax=Emericellopsis atlantica TaxID=2614577 RepID=A0A9P8CN39_9HYPO|nr:uncharacterized protein F5Z01DRAFT_659139 [Emericellopsis atlantica]KAG9253093.1 hypothetical protein F5Z01DRAFT_659139 [Emericellopsis atlantica]
MEDGTFDPERCAALHNQILQRAIAQSPHELTGGDHGIRRDLVRRMRERAPACASWILDTDRDIDTSDDNGEEDHVDDGDGHDGENDARDATPLEQRRIYRFFSQLDRFQPDSLPLTPEFRQPDPRSMDVNDTVFGELDDREIILLYPDNLTDTFMDGGLYVELQTFYATTWRLDISKLPPDESPSWLPLEVILVKMLEMWDRGKFCWDPWSNTVDFVPWVARDLDDALEAWDDLLVAITERMPGLSPSTEKEPMLPADLVEEYEISPFGKAFLSRASRPRFRFVAPGLTTFTPDTFLALMNAEDDASPRRKFNASAPEGSDMFASCLLPSVTNTVPATPEDPTFDRDWGVGKFTIARRPGLYVQGHEFADGTLLITDRGIADTWSFTVRRPWGDARPLRLVEMLDAWTDCVKSGTWDVGEEGVTMSNAWFADPQTKDERTLPWMMHFP